ncbi:MAG: hypothetical protein WA958_18340 [Tunicatimonas sp.]
MKFVSILRSIVLSFALIATTVAGNAQSTPQLLNFQSSVQGGGITFKWAMADQNAVRSFDLERAGMDMQFKAVGNVSTKANQKATYRLTDQEPLSGVAFYRLKIVGNEGNITYCKVVSHQTASAVEVGR